MTDVTFVRTRTYYQPYDDLFRLAELSGFPVIYIDEIDANDASKTYIFTPNNGETLGGWPHARARIIFMQMEWHTDHKPVELPPGVAECWNGDRWHSQLINARHVPMGSHECLNLYPGKQDEKQYDIALMGYYDVWRRARIRDQFKERGITIAPNGWGVERDEILRQSRVMVHVHQWDNMPTIAPLRWCLAAAYDLPIISESVNDRRPFNEGDFLTCGYDDLVEFVTAHLQTLGNGRLEMVGQNLHRTLCRELTFRESVERAL